MFESMERGKLRARYEAARDGVKSGARRARGAVSDAARRHPIAIGVGATGVALGAAVLFKGPLIAKVGVYLVADLAVTAGIAYVAARAAQQGGTIVLASQ